MKNFLSTTMTESSKTGTKPTVSTEYEASAGYFGKALGALLTNRTVTKNLQVSGKNTKALAEKRELPHKKG